jgi:hypothetical protein
VPPFFEIRGNGYKKEKRIMKSRRLAFVIVAGQLLGMDSDQNEDAVVTHGIADLDLGP